MLTSWVERRHRRRRERARALAASAQAGGAEAAASIQRILTFACTDNSGHRTSGASAMAAQRVPAIAWIGGTVDGE